MLSVATINFGKVFWFCALAGTGLVLIQFLMSLMGADHDYHETDHGGSSIEDGKFKWMSRQSAAGFMMMFGWAGVVCTEQFKFSILIALLISVGAGLAAALIAALIFRLAKKAHSPGTVFKIDDAIGKEAVVYHRIPKQGSGKISIPLHGFTHEIDAISPNEEEIPSFTSVQIIKKADGKTVVVVPIK